MMKKLLELEDYLLKAESWVLVVLVLSMLAMASYNVVYRNVLVPIQADLATSGPPLTAVADPTPSKVDTPTPTVEPKTGDSEGGGFGGGLGGDDDNGFGGGLDDGGDSGGFGGGLDDSQKGGSGGFGGGLDGDDAAGDDSGGFGGGLDGAEEKPKTEAPNDAKPTDGSGGFGGGLDGAEQTPDKEAPKEPTKAEPTDGSGGFGGGLDGTDTVKNADKEAPKDDGSGGVGNGVEEAKKTDGSGGFGGGLDGADNPKKADDNGGFGGGLDDGGDDNGGFGGGLDDGGDDSGFGGGLDDSAADDSGFGGGLDGAGNNEVEALDPTPVAPTVPDPLIDNKPIGGPPPEGSMAAKIVSLVDALKLEWIDVLLRQLVILTGFLGAMLATRRRKHINIDALSKLLPKKANRIVNIFTNGLTTVVCVFFAIAGKDLVKISMEFPKEITEWADEWHFQLMFPVGFGLMVVHFGMRTIEATVSAVTGVDYGPEHEGHEARPKNILTADDLGELANPKGKSETAIAGTAEVEEDAASEQEADSAEAATGTTTSDSSDTGATAKEENPASDAKATTSETSSDKKSGSKKKKRSKKKRRGGSK